LTLALARELGPRGINVNTVAPGMTADTGQTANWDEARTVPILAQIPLRRLGMPDDVRECSRMARISTVVVRHRHDAAGERRLAVLLIADLKHAEGSV